MKTIITYSASARSALAMTIAWSIRRNAAAEMGVPVSAVLMSECLKMAWAMVKAGQSITDEIMNDVSAIDRWLKNLCHKYAKVRIGQSTGNNGYDRADGSYVHEFSYDSRLEAPAFRWYGYNEFWLEDMSQEAWAALLRRMNNPAKMAELAGKGKTLSMILWDCAQYGVVKINAQEKKHFHVSFEMTNNNGDDFSLLDVLADDKAVDPADILSDAGLVSLLRDFAASLDDINQYILSAKIQGMTEREMAAHLTANGKKMSNVAVHKRIVKMQAALREYLTA